MYASGLPGAVPLGRMVWCTPPPRGESFVLLSKFGLDCPKVLCHRQVLETVGRKNCIVVKFRLRWRKSVVPSSRYSAGGPTLLHGMQILAPTSSMIPNDIQTRGRARPREPRTSGEPPNDEPPIHTTGEMEVSPPMTSHVSTPQKGGEPPNDAPSHPHHTEGERPHNEPPLHVTG